jgi:hypothetical protein
VVHKEKENTTANMQREHIVFPEERQEEAMITPRHLAPHL